MKTVSSRSQIFLNDSYYIEKVIGQVKCRKQAVLEIGAGGGNLSGLIAESAAFLYCIEVDPALCRKLRRRLKEKPNTRIIEKDIFAVSLSGLTDNLIVFSNVPYHLSSKLLLYLISQRKQITKLYLILQNEFARKLTARPGDKKYGINSCLLGYYAKTDKIFDIPPGAFCPRPEVSSSFIKITFHRSLPYPAKNTDFLFRLIEASFRQRRKKIANILKQQFSREAVFLLEKQDIDLTLRPEQVSLGGFCRISDCLYDFIYCGSKVKDFTSNRFLI